jgi:hypothetical protein
MGTMFTPVQVEITSYEPERVGGQYCIIRIPAKTADTKRSGGNRSHFQH